MKFARQVQIYSLADLLGQGIGLITSPIVTRLLTPEQYGALPLLMAVWAIPAVVRFGGMDIALSFFLARTERPEIGGKRRVIVTTTMVATVACGLVWALFAAVALAGPWLAEYAQATSLELVLFVVGIGPLVISEWYRVLFRFLQAPWPFAQVSVLSRTAAFVVAIPVMYLAPGPQRLMVLLAALVVAQLLGAGWGLRQLHAIGVKPYDRSTFSRSLSRQMLGYGLALAPGATLYGVQAVSDRLLLGWFRGAEEVAILTVAWMLTKLVNLPKTWFALAWDAQMVKAIASEDRGRYLPYMQSALLPIAAVFGGLALLAAAWADPVVGFLYPAVYAPAARMLAYLALAAAVSCLSLVAVATVLVAATPRFHIPVFGAGLIVNVIVGIALIPRLGAMGAVYGTLAAEVLILLSWVVIGLVILRNLPLNWLPTLGLLGAVGVGVVSQQVVSPGIGSGWGVALTATALAVVMIAFGLPRLLRLQWHEGIEGEAA